MDSVECYEELYIHELQVSIRTCLIMVKSTVISRRLCVLCKWELCDHGLLLV
jgi:hypothetical protein